MAKIPNAPGNCILSCENVVTCCNDEGFLLPSTLRCLAVCLQESHWQPLLHDWHLGDGQGVFNALAYLGN